MSVSFESTHDEQFHRDQARKFLPVEKMDLSDKVVIVLGANTGLGFEAAKHFATMNPGKLILACRSPERGSVALEDIRKETGCANVELWVIDLAKFASIKAFADKVTSTVPRLDILVENAGMTQSEYGTTDDGWETVLQSNNLGPELLALLLLPTMIKTAKTFAVTPRLVVLTSSLHTLAGPEDIVVFESAAEVHKTLSSAKHCTPSVYARRYPLVKLLNILFVRELQSRLKSITVNTVNPGLCKSDFTRGLSGAQLEQTKRNQEEVGFSTEEGSRQLVFAATTRAISENELKGACLSYMELRETSEYSRSRKGVAAQRRVWDDMLSVLETVDARVAGIVQEYLAERLDTDQFSFAGA